MGMTFVYVALGGALGAMGRFGLGLLAMRWSSDGFPLAVLSANILGSFLMGLVVVYLAQKNLTQLNPFLMTGVLGGFTTFSAFSLEAYTLFERGQMGQASAYVAASVILSIAALVMGVWMMRSILT